MKTAHKLLPFAALSLLLATGSGALAGANHKTTSGVIWTWGELAAGSSKLVRTPQGLTAQLKTSGLPAGHVMTLWIMFYDNPSACATTPCSPADIGNPATGFDFHYAGGSIVNSNNTTLSGHIRVGETSTSGFAEVGAPAVALTNPEGAQVLLAIHSHGPAQSGTTLAAQMSSYLGGCVGPFLGDATGFATGPGDIPANPGECSTIQLSAHNP